MSIGDSIDAVLPPKYRRDFAIIVLALGVGWEAFAYNQRLEAAEAKANKVDDVQHQVSDLKSDMAVVKQQGSDTNSNVQLLVAAMLGQQQVVKHGQNEAGTAPAPTVAPKPKGY